LPGRADRRASTPIAGAVPDHAPGLVKPRPSSRRSGSTKPSPGGRAPRSASPQRQTVVYSRRHRHDRPSANRTATWSPHAGYRIPGPTHGLRHRRGLLPLRWVHPTLREFPARRPRRHPPESRSSITSRARDRTTVQRFPWADDRSGQVIQRPNTWGHLRFRGVLAFAAPRTDLA
jgi:hypothetical protein